MHIIDVVQRHQNILYIHRLILAGYFFLSHQWFYLLGKVTFSFFSSELKGEKKD